MNTRLLVAMLLLMTPLTWAQSALEVGANTTVYFSDTLNPLVWEDKEGNATLAQVRQRLHEFKPIDSISQIKPKTQYWVVQRLVNRLGENREFIVDASRIEKKRNWLHYQHFVVYPDGSSRELNGPFSDNMSLVMSDIDPHIFNMDTSLSRGPVFTLNRDSEVQLFSRLQSNSTFAASNFSLWIYDRTTYLELRKYGLYLEGILAGLLLPLIISTWYNLLYKRDTVTIIYGLWLLAGLAQILTMPVHDGQRLYEFFLHQDKRVIGVMPAHVLWVGLFSYLQNILFVLFGRTFLGTHRHFPRFHQLTNIYIGFEALRFIVGYFMEHEIDHAIFWALPSIFSILVMAGFPVCAFKRYKQGLRTAQFAAISSGLYVLISLVSVLVILDVPIFDQLPSSGLALFVKDVFVLQALSICLPAMITHLSMQSRARGIEKRLQVAMVAQKEAVENQNKILESTVQDRTRELQTQHAALNKAHELVTDSVQYASRLQRGQLPRAIRLENRFQSFATIWEPRDTIGGDLWWVSSSQHVGAFVLAVADCTGHGVPGAMLSLLVSNSLERIYANSIDEDPATALISLDHYVRTGLNQDRPDSESDDGCDALVLRINRQQQTIEIAGAKIGLFQVDAQGDVTRHAVARCSLGYIDRMPDEERPQVKTISYSPGDLFAIVTDGFTDQIGQSKRGKSSYGYRRLENLLKMHAQEDAPAIAQFMHDDFVQWQGNEARRDDVTAVIFKL